MHRASNINMEEDLILITQLNDFVFCPASIYFHNLFYEKGNFIFQNTDQVNGRAAHQTIDQGTYSTRKNVISGLDVYCEKYGLVGKIDVLDKDKKLLVERKKKVKRIYDGYIFQLYAQYYALLEMGYEVESIRIHSIDDNKNYEISLPDDDTSMKDKFETIIKQMRTFNINDFVQDNIEKCRHCIYEPACDRSLVV